jgi:hypothetical protein
MQSIKGNEYLRSTADRSHAKTNRVRVVLTSEQARDIFRLKGDHGCSSLHSVSIRLASQYNVSSKAIRDIWKGRSWLDSTYDLWDSVDRPPRKTIGRPKGKKDSKPRSRGSTSMDSNPCHSCLPINEGVESRSSLGAFQHAVDLVPQFTRQRLALSQAPTTAMPCTDSAMHVHAHQQGSGMNSDNCVDLPRLDSLIASSPTCQRFIPALSSQDFNPILSAANYAFLRPRLSYEDHFNVRHGTLSCLDNSLQLPALLDSSAAGSAAPSLPRICLAAASQW